MGKLVAAICYFLTLASWRGAEAVEITIDPGAPGETFMFQLFNFDDLNGTVANGNQIDIEFVFSDRKHVEVVNDAMFFYATVDIFWSENVVSTIDLNNAVFYLTNQNGSNIANLTSPNNANVGNHTTFQLIFENISELVFHGALLSFQLPVSTGSPAVVERAFLGLDLVGPPNGRNQYTVGIWLPEPSTITVFGLGLMSLGLLVRRRHQCAGAGR